MARLQQFVAATEWIQVERLDKAIKVLKPVFKEANNQAVFAQLMTLSSELSQVKEQFRIGVLTDEEQASEFIRIEEILLALMQ